MSAAHLHSDRQVSASPRSAPESTATSHRRRRRLVHRAAPLGALAVLAFGAGAIAGARVPEPGQRAVERFTRAWEVADYATMYRALSETARRRSSARSFVRSYRRTAAIATIWRVDTAPPTRAGGAWLVPVKVRTRIFGTLEGKVRLLISGDGERSGIDWTAAAVLPGLRAREPLSRKTELPARAAILARDGTPLAEGTGRISRLGPLAAEIAGRTGPIPSDRAARYARRGVPPGASVGVSGLEREFDERLLGVPGGTLSAGGRVIASTPPRPGSPVRTSIDPGIQRAAVDALAGRFGGIAVLQPRTGEVLALAGIAYSAPQPPGSTFKIVTLAGALDAGTVSRSATFPAQSASTLEGVELENANGEVCGGSLAASFAESCNSVFAPLGVKLGAERLVKAAERFGFNETPSLQGAGLSTIPAPEEIGDDLAVGSTAIGQGKVLATPLAMASVAAAIAANGRRARPSLERGGSDRSPASATSPETARTLNRYMRRVVEEGTGTAADIDGVQVAGKTGTAELRDSTAQEPATGADVLPGQAPAQDISDTDAWFVAFAPARRPRIAVAVLLVGQGAGGDTAAPTAKTVLQAALKAR
jgi:peptidoglycan glycosyltransferase